MTYGGQFRTATGAALIALVCMVSEAGAALGLPRSRSREYAPYVHPRLAHTRVGGDSGGQVINLVISEDDASSKRRASQ